jgi:hypothetical protein
MSRVNSQGYRYTGGFTLSSFKIKYIVLSASTLASRRFLVNSFRGKYIILPFPEEGGGQLGEFIIIELQVGAYIDNGV